jgi:hypothetical protein
MKNQFTVADEATAKDLLNYLQRAKRLDQAGFVKLRAYGNVLAAYVAPVYGSGLSDPSPTIIGLRTMPLDGDFEVDAVVPIESILSQLNSTPDGVFDSPLTITLPEHQHVAWAGVTPPRSGWHLVGTLAEGDLTDIARRGIAEVADSIPPSVGGPIASKIRGSIWGRSVDLKTKLPAGAAFVAAGLGFLTEDEQVEVYHSEGWVRLSTEHGHVLAKQSDLY